MDLKTEHESVPNLCLGCLSAERNLQLLTGELSDMFYKLRNDDENTLKSEQLLLCWECVATIKKMKTFQHRIKQAQVLLIDHLYLKTYNIKGETLELSCLSSLTSILNNSSNKVFYMMENLSKGGQINEQKFNCHNLSKKIDVDINIENDIKDESSNDFGIEEMYKELNLDSKDNIKQEAVDSRNIEIKNDDNLSDKIANEVESKVEKKISANKGKINSKIYFAQRRQYLKFAIISKKEHIATKDYKKICEIVHLNFIEYDNLVKLERCRSGNKKKFKCDECNVEYSRDIDLQRHNSFVHNKLAYPQKCAACKTMIRSKENLPQHWTRVHNTRLRCTLCSKLYRTVPEIKEHLRLKHMKTYTCVTCGIACSSFAEFVKHYRPHEEVKCDYCGIKCRNKTVLVEHIKNIHSPITCPICNYVCLDKKKYKYHKRTNHPDLRNEPISKESCYCVECDKQYDNIYKYRAHLQDSVKHAPRKIVRVPCPECGKIFAKKSFMNNHYRFAHLKVTKHYCEQCDKYFTTGFSLRLHIERVHEKIRPPKDKFCDICGRGFETNANLKRHYRTHTGDKPYKCVYCSAAFTQQQAMKTHQKTQHKLDQ